MSSTAVYVFPSWVNVSTFVIVIVNAIARVPSCTVSGLASLTTDSLVGMSVTGTSAVARVLRVTAVVIRSRHGPPRRGRRRRRCRTPS